MSEVETEIAPSPPRRTTPRIPLNAHVSVGRKIAVYVIASGGFTKIGVSENIDRRVEEIRTLNPHEVSVVMIRTAPRYLGIEIEKRLHAKFAAFRHRGEWFACDPQLVREALVAEIADVPRLVRMDRKHLAEVRQRTVAAVSNSLTD